MVAPLWNKQALENQALRKITVAIYAPVQKIDITQQRTKTLGYTALTKTF